MIGTRTFVVAAALIASTLTPGEVEAAKTDTCLDKYLLCINDASQEEGAFWRTAREFECGVDYYACIKGKLAS